jgi:hypothetical protein
VYLLFVLCVLRASSAGRRKQSARVRSGSIGLAWRLHPLQRGDATGPTRLARPIPGLNLRHVCINLDAGGRRVSSRVYHGPAWQPPRRDETLLAPALATKRHHAMASMPAQKLTRWTLTDTMTHELLRRH